MSGKVCLKAKFGISMPVSEINKPLDGHVSRDCNPRGKTLMIPKKKIEVSIEVSRYNTRYLKGGTRFQ